MGKCNKNMWMTSTVKKERGRGWAGGSKLEKGDVARSRGWGDMAVSQEHPGMQPAEAGGGEDRVLSWSPRKEPALPSLLAL